MVPSNRLSLWFLNTVTNGTSTRSDFSIALANSGVSEILRRMNRPKITRRALARNGTRQPQAMKASSPMKWASTRKMVVAKKKPTGAPNCGNMPYQARLPSGAFSVASSTAPPHSPPRPSPCPRRHSASSSGAATPIWA
ncbi:hypothetical protein D9M68_922870 [compost metagenome]